MSRFIFVYSIALIGSVLVVAGLVEYGQILYSSPGIARVATSPVGTFAAPLLDHLHQPLAILLVQMIVVIICARLLGRLFWRLGQPAVIGEIFAGILLGPSLLGILWPEALEFLFSPPSLPPLQLLSQLGVLLFMFTVGLEVDLPELRRQAPTALLISHLSIAIPFALGVALALVASPLLTPAGVPFYAFGLFMGISMSVTAFPVLARILDERRMMDTVMGRTAIACAAIGDASAWCLLAAIVAIVHAQGLNSAVVTTGLALGFVAGMILVGRPLLRMSMGRRPDAEKPGVSAMVVAIILLLLCSAFTEVIGIHALFGAFLAGTIIPAGGDLRPQLRERLHGFSSIALMPIFFVITGLRTQIGSLHGAQDWALCAAIVLVATVGKLGGTLLVARFTGYGWREAFTLGALMNTRGLMELIVLNIGYDLGILSSRVFTMLVMMALLTTCATGPLLRRFPGTPDSRSAAG